MRRGLALILVVGVLAVLAVLGSAFAVLSRLERRAASQRVNGTRAWLLARSGMEDAQARLDPGQDPAYAGEDFNDDRALNAGPETAAQVFQAGARDRDNCPVQHALRPSFFVKAPGGAPALRSLDGRLRAYSGIFRGDAQQWAVKALPQAGFFLNGGDPSYDAATGYNAVLKRMLGILAKAIDEESAPINNAPVGEADGWTLVDQRPRTARGWESWEQVRILALGGSQAKLDALKPYLTLHAWVDRKVIRPNADASLMENQYFTSMADLRLAHRAPTTGLPEPDFERIPSSPNGAIVGRAPVSLAWARKRKPALLALLGNLEGLYLDGSFSRVTPPRVGTVGRTGLALAWNAADDPHLIASKILSSTSELGTWQQWNQLCDTLPVSGANACIAGAQRAILKANFNPNSDLAKFNPPSPLRRDLDKSDLLVYSTELSLLPVHDHEVECAGRVLGPNGKVLASRILKATLSGPSAFRLDTQREFACQELGRLDFAGDEQGLRLPGAASFLTLSQDGLNARTWGHKLPGLGQGVSLQTYPEPCVNPGSGLTMRPADYDGHLRLATIETPDNEPYGIGAAAPVMKMMARFDDGFDLDLHAGAAFQNLTDTSQVSTAQLANGLYHPTRPVSIFPDGAYCEYGYSPAWYDLGNANGFHGLISFWARSHEPVGWGGSPRMNENGFMPSGRLPGDGEGQGIHRYVHWTHYGNLLDHSELDSQCFWIGPAYYYGGCSCSEGMHCFFETSRDWDDINKEFFFVAKPVNFVPLPADTYLPEDWHLVSVYYDFQAASIGAACEVLVNTRNPLFYGGSSNTYPMSSSVTPAGATDITLPDALGPHRIALGGRKEFPIEGEMISERVYLNGADATLDEFAIYDIGQNESQVSTFQLNRFREGRFYKGSVYTNASAASVPDQAGAWFSPPIRLEGSRLLRAAWTWLRPSVASNPNLLAADYAEVELTDLPGTGYLWPRSRSTLGEGWTRDRQDWKVGRGVRAPFRLHVVFRRTAPVDANTPILDSPVLDDLTIVYRERSRSPFLGWGN